VAKKRIVILGAGLSGLSAAWHLRKRGVDCRVFEKEPEVGGLCRSPEIRGFTFDCAGHLLHFKQAYAFELVKSLLKSNLVEHRRSSWVQSFNTHVRYPFQANLNSLPYPVARECLTGFIRAQENVRLSRGEKLSFRSWINRKFGKGIARHFMEPFNRKFWTLPLEELTSEWPQGIIPVPSLGQVLEGLMGDSSRSFGYNASFWYPRTGGIKQIPLLLAGQVENIHTGCPVKGIDINKKKIKLGSGDFESYDYLITTLPLPQLAGLIKGLRKPEGALFGKLRWNSVFNLNLGIDGDIPQKMHWLYFPQKEVSFFRVGFFHNFSCSLAPRGKSSLYVEAAYSKAQPINKVKIITRIKEDLKKTGLLKGSDRICCQQINDIEYGYPVYDLNYNRARNRIIDYLGTGGIIPCGRYGSWRYFSMEDSLLDGRRAADLIIDGHSDV
jgi:protoporphyrinogen oxidase